MKITVSFRRYWPLLLGLIFVVEQSLAVVTVEESQPVILPGGTTSSAASLGPRREDLELRYEAFVAGALAGKARLVLRHEEATYAVNGVAKSEGILDAFNPWRATFRANGQWVAGERQLIEYHYTEKDNRKRREVLVSNGRLQVVKNGRQRPERHALPGLDILTALFVVPTCHAELDLHTGRHGYRLVGDATTSSAQTGEPASNVCEYRAVDDEGDSYGVVIEFTSLAGNRVPNKITLSGVVTGRMILVRHKTVPRKTVPHKMD